MCVWLTDYSKGKGEVTTNGSRQVPSDLKAKLSFRR